MTWMKKMKKKIEIKQDLWGGGVDTKSKNVLFGIFWGVMISK